MHREAARCHEVTAEFGLVTFAGAYGLGIKATEASRMRSRQRARRAEALGSCVVRRHDRQRLGKTDLAEEVSWTGESTS
ncbi:hypothetical protein PC116_g5507 [Phytophthora cactorum]|uniref:Uncharacterized protein n=1 Tax=Phytophthora cactorum TaxID=29920 RepID=A0A8T1LG01_9STRA|nr:hypothetical protein Pcac1_g24766 [Phytophthora cactorum]KAG2944783.1 hypothetical protein PC117_g8877 [Phytophthora cactorum]KAG3004562.1 hypothetical protein PC119_g15604 [Phytophthora cactorum]KAG4045562.1 hypothetical protein PC123_g19040 [Phytophthora cactorum]KAG4246698.1 hypothetical protein PC116_g5507 [Phytophthora cactorum]